MVFLVGLPLEKTNVSSGVASVSIVGSGTGAVTFGHLFAEGDIPGAAQIDNGQVISKTTWPDGSLRFAVISGIFTGGSSPVISTGDSSGANLTESQLITALGTTTIQLSGGVSGTINAADLISGSATPTAPGMIAWQDGPYCIERIVGAQISGNVYGFFHCRLYSNNALSVDFVVENCEGISAAADSISGVNVTFTLDGSQAFSLSNQTLYLNSRFMETAWDSDPVLHAAPDLTYFYSTLGSPKYVSGATINTYSTSLTWNDVADLRTNWGGAGYHEQIGPLPGWDVHTIRDEFSDIRPVIVNAKALNQSGVCYKDNATGYPVDFRTYGTANINGWSGNIYEGTGSSLTSNTSASHSPQEGYLAYILTGKYYFLETQWYCAGNCLLQSESPTENTSKGTDLQLYPDDKQARGAAWLLLNVARCAFTAPDGHAFAAMYTPSIPATFDDLYTRYVLESGAEYNVFGIVQDYHFPSDFRAFMHDFYTGAVLEAARMGLGGTNNDAVAAWVAQWVQGRTSYNGDTTWCWQDGPGYDYGGQPPYTGGAWMSDWEEFFTTVFPAAGACDLNGGFNFEDWASGMPGNMFYPVSEAHGLGYLSGREYQRHFDAIRNEDFIDEPVWGFGTRGSVNPAPSWITALSLNAWTDQGTNVFSDVSYTPASPYQGSTGPNSVLITWNGSTYVNDFSPSGGTAGSVIHWGGGHNDYHGNEVYVFDLSNRTWSRLNAPYLSGAGSGTDGIYADGTPVVPHTRNEVPDRVFDRGEFVTGVRQLSTAGGDNIYEVSRFNLTSLTWTNSTVNPGISISFYGVFAYDELRDQFVYSDGRTGGLDWAYYNPDTDSYTTYDVNASKHDPLAIAQVVSKDVFLLFNDGQSNVILDPNAPTTYTTLSTTGSTIPSSKFEGDTASYSKNLDAVYFWDDNTTGQPTIYRIDTPYGAYTNDWTVSTVSLTGTVDMTDNTAGAFTKFKVIDYDDATIAVVVTNPNGSYQVARLM